MEVKDLKDLKDVVKPICEISGSWLRELKIHNKVYWNIDEDVPFRFVPKTEDVLPSDWRYREDLLWLKYGY